MNHEEFTAIEFQRAVTWAPSMTSRVLIGGLPYMPGELLADMADVSGHDYRDEIFAVLARVARDGDYLTEEKYTHAYLVRRQPA